MRNSSETPHALVLSYLGLLRAIGFVALSLPILLGPLGWLLFGIGIQANMSSYYHTPMRDVFVGVMCSIAIFLFCYRGSTWLERWTSNLSFLAAISIALCPIDANGDSLQQRTIAGYIHTIAGGTFFFTLAMYSLIHFPQPALTQADEDSDGHLHSEHGPSDVDRRARNFVYYVSGFVILASMAGIGTCFFLVSQEWNVTLNAYGFVFWMEWLGVWAFSAAWLTKGRAIFDDVSVPLEKLTKIVRGTT